MKPEKTHLDNTGELANRHVSSIARIPGRAAAVGPVLKGGLSPDHCPGHSADRPWGSPQPPASALTVSKCQAWEVSDAGRSGHRPHKQPQSPGASVWSTSSRCLSPRDSSPRCFRFRVSSNPPRPSHCRHVIPHHFINYLHGHRYTEHGTSASLVAQMVKNPPAMQETWV